jgi:transposase
MEKAYRYRFYPTTEQEQILRRTIGCVRLVFNRALAARTEAWYEKQEKVDLAATQLNPISSQIITFVVRASCPLYIYKLGA